MVFVSMLVQKINFNIIYFTYLFESNLVFTWKQMKLTCMNTEVQLAVIEIFLLSL